MTKKIISDIIISKKSIRQIPIVAERKRPIVLREGSWQRKPLNPKLVIWLMAGVCFLALFFGVSIIFSSATIIITPKTEKITFTNDLYTAKTNSLSTTTLSFEVLTVKQTISETVEATEEKSVSQKATGKIIIYNNYSLASQRLINNTRFESTDGRIYRINSSVIVPGLKKSNGQTIPGSVEATVYADQAGESYNLKLSDLAGDFKIPGFKGDLRYQGFYARLKEDIKGGFIGQQRIISETLRQTTEKSLQTKLQEQLIKELYAIKPENYLVFKDGYTVNYANLPDLAIDNNKVKMNLEGNLTAIVFNNSKLTKYIATKKIKDFDNLPVELIPADNLTAVFILKDNTNFENSDTLQIKLNGEAVIKWQYDSEAIKKDLASKAESDLKNLIVKYKDSVVGIQVFFRPVWTRYFPDDLTKIKIQEA